MKRSWFLIGCFLVAGAVLVGCGDREPPVVYDQQVKPDGPVTVDGPIKPADGSPDKPIVTPDAGVDGSVDALVCKTPADCKKLACNAQSCGKGCVCQAGAASETLCGDGADNDNDGLTDCKDKDCNGASCGPNCICGSGVKQETQCGDSVDNDKDGFTDCKDSDCNGLACGVGCLCSSGDKVELFCQDNKDNDGDNNNDCADSMIA